MRPGDHDFLLRMRACSSISLASAPSLPGSLSLLPSVCSLLAALASSPTSTAILLRLLLTPTNGILVPSSSAPRARIGARKWVTGYSLLLSPRGILKPSRSRLTNSKHKAERSLHNRSVDSKIHLENYIYNTINGSTVGVLRCCWIPSARGGAYLIHRALDFILLSVLLTITDLAIMGVGLFSTPAIHFDIW